ncbi:hypothetical protein DVH05_000606 [Phytophthora capsici]|nr:hypothetical protein DVH05_000606 [Phytophthora capsici]
MTSMSFVLLEDDEDCQATVQEAFDMIDAYDDIPMLSDISRESESSGVKRSRREQNRERDFRRRRRQKEERMQLEMQAQRLESYLTQLKESGRSSEVSRESSCVTPEILKQRVEAELLNQSLKKALAAEKKWSKSLQSVLNKRQSMEVSYLLRSFMFYYCFLIKLRILFRQCLWLVRCC